jgi:DNA-binding SARP family transcriptional activator
VEDPSAVPTETVVDGSTQTATSDASGRPLILLGEGSHGQGGRTDGEESRHIEVLVLGPAAVTGVERPLVRAWTLDLLVYLAMHPGGASNDQWSTALWPDRVMAASSLHSTVSAARRCLGTDPTGRDYLPRGHGRLALDSSIASDWTRFSALASMDDPSCGRQALSLIRGRPFGGLRSWDWVLLEGILASIETVVVEVACRYADHCLANGDAAAAEWGARQGLRVSAYDERLYRVLLRAADAAGNPAGVESTMSELVRLVSDGAEVEDAVHPETLDLYRSLSRRPVSARR